MLKLETTFAGRVVPLELGKWQRRLTWAHGDVADGIPVILRWRGPRRRAEKLAARLTRYGYAVKMVRLEKEQ